MGKPFKIDGEQSSAPTPNTVDGVSSRMPRSGAEVGPPNPLAQTAPGEGVIKVQPAWAPGIGQNSSTIRQQHKPYEPIKTPALPFKVSGGKQE